MIVPLNNLGQSGFCLHFPDAIIYVDPYLSNSVQELDSPDLSRLAPIPFPPEEIVDADWVLITHHHIDHCDPHTLPALAAASPTAKFIGPSPVIAKLNEWGISQNRTFKANCTDWLTITPRIKLIATLSAHPEVLYDELNSSIYVGYIIECDGKRIYHAGDTSLSREVIDDVVKKGPLHTAFLPVNERNYFRERRGIIGNMSVREAFGFAQEVGVKNVVPVHWDMFAANEVTPEEIFAVYDRLQPKFRLSFKPTSINLGDVKFSFVIRTLNEARYLQDLLEAILRQNVEGSTYEVVIVDSGSTDGTLDIARNYGCRILHINREDFSFGRSLNIGCEAALGEVLVITSGHCVPVDEKWLSKLCAPLFGGDAEYVYGRQIGGSDSYFSETRIFNKYFPEQSKIPQKGFNCNNANSALLKSIWQRYKFNEELTGLEDMELAKRLVLDHGRVAYVGDASVYHYHSESWSQIRRRFEREAIALQQIMPQVHVSVLDTLRYFVVSVFKDFYSRTHKEKKARLKDIVLYRWNQYWGTFKGNHKHRKLSIEDKEKYFFPE
ncbi:MBL fold metallo-hydrolase [Pseudohongiella sp. SYSU M77423]|uniref:MBL fold metallo-hydrolase n=1 Tax=Pseudohongiella sp. SYSU M77423 TaxID=3042312 RepID=UPI00247FD4C5|nr:MBL fold metallo-hydrolase [Pseudohongiella sp. SYSU M77423]MDH7944939.1 MBL fold metallo-hydrolase [Pseudohongiella sp. SYSU M77423]